MEFGEESSPALAFEKDAFELTVEDVYDISYVIGRDLLKVSSTGEDVSDLQFRIVRVLEMFETLVNKYNLSLEELKMERDNLKGELDRIVKERSSGQGTVSITVCAAECFVLRRGYLEMISLCPGKADSGTKPAGGGPHRPQQTALHDAGAERGSAREEPAEGSAHRGSGGASALQEVAHTLWPHRFQSLFLLPLTAS